MIDLDALTKISRQLSVSMGSMMGMVNLFAVAIYMILIYLLSKIIIEKNAQSISMTKILGYTNGEISRLYILSTSIVIVLRLRSWKFYSGKWCCRVSPDGSRSGLTRWFMYRCLWSGLWHMQWLHFWNTEKSGKYRWVRHLKMWSNKKSSHFILLTC